MLRRCDPHRRPAIKQVWLREAGSDELRLVEGDPAEVALEAPEGAWLTVAYVGCACIDRLEILERPPF